MKARPLLVLVAAAALAASGCDEKQTIRTKDTTRVRVLEAGSGEPVAGVKVVLMRRTDNCPAADPLRTDAQGVASFPAVYGDVAALVFGGGLWRAFGDPQWWYGKQADGLLQPLTPPEQPDPQVLVVATQPPGGVHVSGTVVDAATDAPLGAVFISTSPYPDAYNGNIGPSDDVSLADGSFRVSEILFVADPQTGRASQAIPLWVTRHGYRPRLWRYEPGTGEVPDEITGVRIALERDEGGERGSLRGRVLRGGNPAHWVVVGLGWAELPGADKAGAGMTGWTALTDADGEFVFADLPVGRYVVHPGFLDGDSDFYPDQPANRPREVTAGAETDAGDFVVLWELMPHTPRSGVTVADTTRIFAWDAGLPLASFDVYLDDAQPVRVVAPRYRRPEEEPLAPGFHTWYVVGRDAQGDVAGAFGRAAEFLVAEPPAR